MVVQVRAQGSVVDRLEKLVAGCGGTVVRASTPVVDEDVTAEFHTDMEGDGWETVREVWTKPADQLTTEELQSLSDDEFGALYERHKGQEKEAPKADKALDVAVVAPRGISSRDLKEFLNLSIFRGKVRGLVSAGPAHVDKMVSHYARAHGLQSLVLTPTNDTERHEMLLWFSNALFVIWDKAHHDRLIELVEVAEARAYEVEVWDQP